MKRKLSIECHHPYLEQTEELIKTEGGASDNKNLSLSLSLLSETKTELEKHKHIPAVDRSRLFIN